MTPRAEHAWIPAHDLACLITRDARKRSIDGHDVVLCISNQDRLTRGIEDFRSLAQLFLNALTLGNLAMQSWLLRCSSSDGSIPQRYAADHLVMTA